MAHVRLRNVTLQYPIFTPQTRTIKSALFTRLGGKVSGTDQTVVVSALTNLNLDLVDGDRLGIIGHNGAGKSTLLKVLSGIYEPQSGTVDVQGEVSSFVDITLGMDPEANGWENIYFRGAFMGMSREEIDKLAPGIAEFSELGSYLDLPIRTYSTGMYMRLAFAIATSVHPEIIVMDEMIGAGDASFLDKAIARIERMLGQTKIVVVATHSNFIITKFCNKVLWLDKGELRGFGPVDKLLEDYREAVGGGTLALGV